MLYAGIVDQGSSPTVNVQLSHAGEVATGKVSKNGGSFSPSANQPVSIDGSVHYSLKLSPRETDTLGSVYIVISAGGEDASVQLQVRNIVSELGSLALKQMTPVTQQIAGTLKSITDTSAQINKTLNVHLTDIKRVAAGGKERG